MPPRRPPRRGKKHGSSDAPALAGTALKDVRRAHSLVERGDHANAAQLFERQARDAADRGIYLPAAHLYLQAGRARLLAGESSASEQMLHQGLGILADYLNPHRLALSSELLFDDLLNMGQSQLAADLRMWLERTLEKNQTLPVGSAGDHPIRTSLSIQCPRCNAILRPADLEAWDSTQDICVYCGSLIGK